jgi:hypothetical protein
MKVVPLSCIIALLLLTVHTILMMVIVVVIAVVGGGACKGLKAMLFVVVVCWGHGLRGNSLPITRDIRDPTRTFFGVKDPHLLSSV